MDGTNYGVHHKIRSLHNKIWDLLPLGYNFGRDNVSQILSFSIQIKATQLICIAFFLY